MEFQASSSPSLGLELELQLLDSHSLGLVNGILPLLQVCVDNPLIKPEFNQATVEINSRVCANVAELQADLLSTLRFLKTRCQGLNMKLCGAGTHPFCDRFVTVTPLPRYLDQQSRMGYLADLMMTCALQVHIGMPSGDVAIAVMNQLRPYLPILLALSASSPFWWGQDTGYASYRYRFLSSLRTYGMPPTFKTWSDFADFFKMAQHTGMCETIRDLHWDLRPQSAFGTLEVRVMDAQPTLQAALMLAAFIHSLVEYLQTDWAENRASFGLMPHPWWIEKENYFRASHSGLDGNYIEDEQGNSRPIRAIVQDILAAIETTAHRLGEAAYLQYLKQYLDEGPSYIRQRRILQNTGSLEAVVADLVRELQEEITQPVLGASDGVIANLKSAIMLHTQERWTPKMYGISAYPA
jgi:carboxylate-amine ligase